MVINSKTENVVDRVMEITGTQDTQVSVKIAYSAWHDPIRHLLFVMQLCACFVGSHS